MPEQLTASPEHEQQHETLKELERLRTQHAEHHQASPQPEKDPRQALKEARHSVHETVRTNKQHNPLERLKAAEQAAAPAHPHPKRIDRELKQITVQREIKQIQRQLPAQERALSKLIHQPTVQVISEVAGKTVSRPSGLLGGGLVALIGTTSYLYLARHIGFTYNYGVFLVLFFGGFVVGLALEWVVHLSTASRHHRE